MAKHKLLVIDDDMMFARMIVEFFKRHGYDVSVADSPEEAVRQFQKHRPKVVLLDFNMPLVNGDRLLPVLQNIDAGVKAVVISGCSEEEVEEKFKGLGYFAFFQKGSTSLETLKVKIDEAILY